MKVDVISTGSKGNAVLYDSQILVDCGVSYSKLEPYLSEVKLILLTHIHKDHFNVKAIQKVHKNHPGIIFACCYWLYEALSDCGLPIICLLEVGKLVDFTFAKVCPIVLYHDVPNCGYRIYVKDEKILHATDTFTLDGIVAKGYDIYSLEWNHDEIQIEKDIQEKLDRGEYAYEIGAKNSHLSFQKTQRFFDENRKEESRLIKLHISEKYL